MNGSSTRLARSIIADRHREAAEWRRSARSIRAGDRPSAMRRLADLARRTLRVAPAIAVHGADLAGDR